MLGGLQPASPVSVSPGAFRGPWPLSSGLVGPLLVVVAGLVVLGGGIVVLRSFGPGYRVGRLLAATPIVSIELAERFAAAGTARYVRVDGRLDSPDDFPDENDRPLVFRRRRLEVRREEGWTVVEEDVQVVPFEIRDGLAAMQIDVAALGAEPDALVVLPRESAGSAADAPERVPAGTPPTTPVRYRVEQISAVEHASVLGVPERRVDGSTVMTAGLGRPLIVSTLEPTEAMQLLAGGRRVRPIVAMALLAGGISLIVIGLLWAVAGVLASAVAPAVAFAASPEASGVTGGDTRSAGEGPGLVGSPLVAIAIVALIGLGSAIVSYAYVRLTARRAGGGRDEG
jgi:hypothetical protein